MKCRASRIPWNSILTVNMSSSAKKQKNHYINLGINTKATQEEVKTAYFKMSMQYHPDKNTSEDAKIKFREISDAYEVLGNFNKRKNYDRGINIRTSAYESYGGDGGSGEGIKKQDLTKEAFRARSEIFRHSSAPSNQKIYDFDEWTKAHYGNVFKRSQLEKQNLKMKKKYKESFSEDSNSIQEFSKITLFLFVCLVILVLGTSNDSSLDCPELVSSHLEKIENAEKVTKKDSTLP